uniref:Uncharacterized protein n=1 Tax=Ralstonia solanacearum TaxID=305 RepID=A0A809E6G4_RALSL
MYPALAHGQSGGVGRDRLAPPVWRWPASVRCSSISIDAASTRYRGRDGRLRLSYWPGRFQRHRRQSAPGWSDSAS